jgi:hypothetical protein
MNLSEFKVVEQSIIDKCTAIGGSFQLFVESKGISRNKLTIFEDELKIPSGNKFSSFVIFTEIHESMYFAIIPFENIVWGKVKGHKNRSFNFEIDMANSVEFFLDAFSERQIENILVKEKPVLEGLRPDYYDPTSVYEPRKIIRHYKLPPNIANVVKYVLRAGKKNKATLIEDLKKAITYLQFEIEDNEEEQ